MRCVKPRVHAGLRPQAEDIIVEEQAGFRKGRSTTEQIFNLRTICEKHLQHQRQIYHVFIDFKKALDRVWHGHSGGRKKEADRKKRWTDNVEEWTGKHFAETQALAHDYDIWNRLVHSLSRRHPNDSSRS
ncbi:hypothetical protein ACOMHN_004927 [Nucella lapillus]